MPKPVEEVRSLYEELRAWYAEAYDDPQRAGPRLRQKIIDRAAELSSSTGDFWPQPPAGSSPEDVEACREEAEEIKTTAEVIKRWALSLPAGE